MNPICHLSFVICRLSFVTAPLSHLPPFLLSLTLGRRFWVPPGSTLIDIPTPFLCESRAAPAPALIRCPLETGNPRKLPTPAVYSLTVPGNIKAGFVPRRAPSCDYQPHAVILYIPPLLTSRPTAVYQQPLVAL